MFSAESADAEQAEIPVAGFAGYTSAQWAIALGAAAVVSVAAMGAAYAFSGGGAENGSAAGADATLTAGAEGLLGSGMAVIAAPSPSPTAVPPTVEPSTSPAPTPTASATPAPTTPAPAPEPTPEPAPEPEGDFTGWSQDEIRVLELTNKTRKEVGCPALKPQSQLHAAAEGHSKHMAKVGKMEHDGIGDGDLTSRINASGYKWSNIAENIAYGYRNAAAVMDGWINSPGHYANIINCELTELGVSKVNDNGGTPYWTQNFGRPRE